MKLVIVGVGKMGGAVMEGVISKGLLKTSEIGIIDHNPTLVDKWVQKYGVKPMKMSELGQAERVLLALQPRHFLQLSDDLARPSVGYISTMAGISTTVLARRLGTKRVVRVMPNLGATIGKSQSAVTGTREANEYGDLAFGHELFSSVGSVYDIPENLFNAFTGMVGSGPAYAAVFAEALADGGVRVGLPRAQANELAAKLLITTGELLLQKAHPAILKDEVASPGGTTIAGLEQIERYTFRAAAIEAVIAATKRGNELGMDE